MGLSWWKRIWMWMICICSVAGVAAVGYGMKYLDGEEVFGAFAIVLLLVGAAAAGLTLYPPKDIDTKLPGFARLTANIATGFFVFAVPLGAVSVLSGPYI